MADNKASILIVEDDLTFLSMIKTWLGRKGFDVTTATTINRACECLGSSRFDLVLSDMRLPDSEGISLLDFLGRKEISTPLIIMTSYADVQNAVNAMKHGAKDYISKPIQPELLLEKITDALSASTATPLQAKAKTTIESKQHNEYIIGDSNAAKQLYEYVSLVAPTPMSVLVTGSNGTGKEHIAHRIHQLSRRANRPFVAIDCGSLLKELSASEFFGHVKGSFTGAVTDKTGAFVEANGGTLFLDEVGNLSYDVQVQLLRALQERKIRPIGSTKEIDVDIRLICATNRNLPQAIAQGGFREDLYHRINEFTLRMPDLRERGNDILLFARFFLNQANKELDRNISGFTADAKDSLLRYSWPGNLRQLKNVIKRATLLARDNTISRNDLGEEITLSTETSSLQLRDYDDEKSRIIKALETAENNKAKAARLLGIDRKTLYNKLKSYDL